MTLKKRGEGRWWNGLMEIDGMQIFGIKHAGMIHVELQGVGMEYGWL